MAKPLNEKCFRCAFVDAHQAREYSCWNSQTCPKRRWYYRNRQNNIKHKKYNIDAEMQVIDSSELVNPRPYLVLVVYVADVVEANLNALKNAKIDILGLSAEIWHESNLVAAIKPFLCASLEPVEIDVAITNIFLLASQTKLNKYDRCFEFESFESVQYRSIQFFPYPHPF